METTLMNCIKAAKAQTAASAEMKDWRIRNWHNKMMRNIAREMVADNGGYIIATPEEIESKYGVAVGSGKSKMVWSIRWNRTWRKLEFASAY